MNLAAINTALASFQQEIEKKKLSDIDWLYEKQFMLKQHELISADDFLKWMKTLFQSDRTQRYWQREDVRSKELMEAFIEVDTDMVFTCFKDLFDERRDLEGRIDRFKFYMDELLTHVRRKQTIKESWHHQDNSIISFYLMMRYPEKYVYYTRALHEQLVALVQAKPLGEGEDVVRYMKMAKTVSIFLMKEEDLMATHKGRFSAPIVEQSLLPVYEMLFEASQKK